jgi:feruloyl esterase
MVYGDSNWDFHGKDLGQVYIYAAKKVGPILDAVNPDLTQFRAHHAKLIHFTGWNDGSPPPMHSVDYYNKVVETTGGLASTQQFYRLFMAPGVMHCGYGPGPNDFGNAVINHEPQRDADHDIFTALQRWVEQGRAPERVIATKYAGDDRQKGVQMTRPLCPYPQQAVWVGRGATDDQMNFTCQVVK